MFKRRTLEASLIALMAMSTIIFGADNAPDNDSAPPRLYKGQVFVQVPEAIRKDLNAKACSFGRMVYPDIQEEALKKAAESFLLKDRYVVTGMHSRSGMGVWSGKGVPSFSMSFPAGEHMALGAREPPPGVLLKKRQKALTIEEAEPLANRVMVRLTGSQPEYRDLTLRATGDFRPSNFEAYYFDWRSYSRSPDTWGRMVRVEVRKEDGLITRVELRHSLPRPTLSFDEAAKLAKASFKDFDPENLSPGSVFHAGITRMTWYYAVPPPPEGDSRDDTEWDATTGEILYSKVLKGGKPEKPYENPVFYTEVNEEVYKRNIEKVIRDRVAELEKEKP